MKFSNLLTLCLAVTTSTAMAQGESRGICGTGDVDIEITKANIAAAEAYAKTHPAEAKGAIRYFPIRFKITGNTDGTAESPVFDVMSLVESINRDFAPYNWRFFVEDVNGVPFDYFFDDARNTKLSQDAAFLEANRATSAITIYVTGDATTPNSSGVGVTLGYYSFRQDILVVRTSEIGSNAATASHELGHYFGLPHTFRGWDCVTWEGTVCSDTTYKSPVTQLIAPCTLGGNSIPVELVTRGSGANCATAGDLFCDTPADYQFGLGYPSCSYDGAVKDRNGDALAPAENNFMSYFQDCNPYEFSPQQFAAMAADVRGSRRSFLSEQSVPINLDSVRLAPQILTPSATGATQFGDEATITWDAIPGALYYYLEVNTSRNFSDRTAILQVTLPATVTSYTIKNLKPDRLYSTRVRAFNQLTVGLPSPGINFRTGTISATTSPEALRSFSVFPNPLSQGSDLIAAIEVERSGEFDAVIFDVTGRQLSAQRLYLAQGSNRATLPTASRLAAGQYIVRVSGPWGVSTRRFNVQ